VYSPREPRRAACTVDEDCAFAELTTAQPRAGLPSSAPRLRHQVLHVVASSLSSMVPLSLASPWRSASINVQSLQRQEPAIAAEGEFQQKTFLERPHSKQDNGLAEILPATLAIACRGSPEQSRNGSTTYGGYDCFARRAMIVRRRLGSPWIGAASSRG
jgi:hypothetical protein